MSLQFKNLPLVQVSLKLIASAPIDLTFESALAVRDSAPGLFPRIEKAPMLSQAPMSEFVFIGDNLGILLSGGESGIRVQLQNDLIEIIWSSPDPFNRQPYPRFPALVEATEVVLRALPKSPTFSVANMVYINFVPTGRFPTVADVQRYADFSFGNMIGPDERIHSSDISWKPREAEGIDSRIGFQAAMPLGGEPQAFIITTTAGTGFSQTTDPLPSVQIIHDYLQEMFLKLITDHARKEWELV